MKKASVLIALLFIITLVSFSGAKSYRLTDGEGAMLWQTLETAKKVIPNSEAISAKEASASLMAIDSIQKVLYKQYSDTTKK